MNSPFPLGRACAGILIAALAATLVLCVALGFLGFLVFPFVYLLTVMVGGLVALPLYRLLHRLGIARGWMAPLAGLVAAITGMSWLDEPAGGHPLLPPFCYASAGIAGGFAFWWHLRASSPPAAPSGSSPVPPEPRP